MQAENDPLLWVQYAEDDYLAAQRMLRGRRKLAHPSAFHSQQCAEKYLKALLISRGQEPPRSHDLTQLYLLCERCGVVMPFDKAMLDTLSSSAVDVRYPGDPITLDEAREALQIARHVRRHVRKLMGLPRIR